MPIWVQTMISRDEFLTQVQVDEWKKQETRNKKEFFDRDCLKPSCDIYWKMINEPETNPVDATQILQWRFGDEIKKVIIDRFIDIGEFSRGGGAFKIDREFVSISGYVDALHVEGFPVKVFVHADDRVDWELEKGRVPSEHYCYQLAVCMDYLDNDKGVIISVNRAIGGIWFSDVLRKENGTFECNGFTFDLHSEYKRFRKIAEDNIHERKEPALEYQYRPKLTTELLLKYPTGKVEKAIKGDRILCDHNWNYQYSPYKDLIIAKEAKSKGITVDELCAYPPSEIDFMIDYIYGEKFGKFRKQHSKYEAPKPRKKGEPLPTIQPPE